MNKKVIIFVIVLIVLIVIACVTGIIIKKNNKNEAEERIRIKREKIVEYLKANVGIKVYFNKDSSEETISEFIEEIGNVEGIVEIKRISKEEALEELKEKFENNKEIIDEYSAEVLPESIVIKIKDESNYAQIEEQIIKINSNYDCIEEMSNGYYNLENNQNRYDDYNEEELQRVMDFYDIK